MLNSSGKNDQLDIDAVFRPGIDTPLSLSTFNEFKMGSMAENPILIDEEQDKENSPRLPTTPDSERPTQTPCVDEKSPIRNKN